MARKIKGRRTAPALLNILLVTAFLCLIPLHTAATRWLPEKNAIIPDHTAEKIIIDGNLDENIWKHPPLSRPFKTYNPVYGEDLKKETFIWMAYDARNLYFAFKCPDPEGKIKTSISPRDKIFDDDYVAVVLDTVGSKQSGYEWYVNPNGIQADGINSAVSGPDYSPDFVWKSAGKLTAEGYQVELRIPLESIRFRSGAEVNMGVLFLRNIGRTGTAGSWPEIHPGKSDLNCMVPVLYKNLKYRRKVEILPYFTYNRTESRGPSYFWNDSTSNAVNGGISFKYGLTSSITAEAAINPDFSHVESDGLQVNYNRRYPIFNTEKRPFFMEGTDILDFGRVSNGMMVSSVHTRTIVSPAWAGKLSGTVGGMSFALLAANDRYPGQEGDSWDVNPDEGQNAIRTIARGKFTLGGDNSIGLLYSGYHFAGDKNNVMGLDLQVRPLKNVQFKASYLYSSSEDDDRWFETVNGSGISAMVQYFIPRFTGWATYEWYGKNFEMQSAFINRTGISRAQVFLGPNVYYRLKGGGFLRRIQPYLHFSYLHDLRSGMDDTYLELGTDFYFSTRGFLGIAYHRDNESWENRHFPQKYLEVVGEIQPSNWLTMSANFRVGDRIFYSGQGSTTDTGTTLQLAAIVQPAVKLRVQVNWMRDSLTAKSFPEFSYKYDNYSLRVFYNFNKHLFVRASVWYENYSDTIQTDLLASFTLIPGTVIHLGYGSRYEYEQTWAPGGYIDRKNFSFSRGALFLKVSYLWRL